MDMEEAAADGLDEGDEDVEAQEDNPEDQDTRWYHKCEYFLDHVATVSRKICIKPGSRLSIKEMMKRFKGRSGQTTRIDKFYGNLTKSHT